MTFPWNVAPFKKPARIWWDMAVLAWDMVIERSPSRLAAPLSGARIERDVWSVLNPGVDRGPGADTPGKGCSWRNAPPVPQVHVAPGLRTAGWVADCVNISDRFAGTPCVCSSSLTIIKRCGTKIMAQTRLLPVTSNGTDVFGLYALTRQHSDRGVPKTVVRINCLSSPANEIPRIMVCNVLTPIGLFSYHTPVFLKLGLGRCQKSSQAGFSWAIYFSNDATGHIPSCIYYPADLPNCHDWGHFDDSLLVRWKQPIYTSAHYHRVWWRRYFFSSSSTPLGPYTQTAASAPRIPCTAKQLGYLLTTHQYHTAFPWPLHLLPAYVWWCPCPGASAPSDISETRHSPQWSPCLEKCRLSSGKVVPEYVYLCQHECLGTHYYSASPSSCANFHKSHATHSAAQYSKFVALPKLAK